MGRRRQGTKGVTALFVLIVASFPSDTEAEQDGGGGGEHVLTDNAKKKKPRVGK